MVMHSRYFIIRIDTLIHRAFCFTVKNSFKSSDLLPVKLLESKC